MMKKIDMEYVRCCSCCISAAILLSPQPDGVGQLVVGTEDKRVLLLGPGATSVSSSLTLPAVPALISTAGGLDAGYRVTVAARDGWLYSVKGGVLAKTVIQLDSQPVTLVGTCTHTTRAHLLHLHHAYLMLGASRHV
jgi:hypothetical protein